MYQIKTTIEGIAPILFNRFTEKAQGQLETGRSSGKQTIEEKRKEALTKVYSNNEGLFCPSKSIKKAILLACSIAGLKRGKKGLGPILNAIMFIEPLEIPFGKKKPDYIDEQSGRIPPGPRGTRVMIYRPALKEGWQLNFKIKIFDDIIPPQSVKQALIDAGVYQGICDGRPECGRFTVKEFEVIE